MWHCVYSFLKAVVRGDSPWQSFWHLWHTLLLWKSVFVSIKLIIIIIIIINSRWW